MKRRLWIAWAASLALNPARADDNAALTEKLKAAVAHGGFEDPFTANVWLTLMSQRMSRYNDDPIERLEILSAVHQHAKRVDVPAEMVLAVIHIESRFQRFALSWVGAQGLMQVMPFWKDEIGYPQANLFDIDTNIRFGCTILKHYLDRESGNWQRALARYNGSLGKTWYPEKVMRAWDRYWYPG